MKRCLFVCLFVCAMSLVNVVNAEYKWTDAAPQGVATDAWKVVTFTGTGTTGQVVDTVNTAGASVSIVGSDVTISFVGTTSENKFDLASLVLGFDSLGDSISTIKVNGVATGPAGWSIITSGYPDSSNPAYLEEDGVQPLGGYINTLTFSARGTPVSYTFAFASSLGNEDPDPVTPEPATLAIFGLGLAGLGLCRRMRKK